MEPLSQWTCDSCNQEIAQASDGWLEWHTDGNGRDATGYRIVHHDDLCMYREIVLAPDDRYSSDGQLDAYTGLQGHALLLKMLADEDQRDHRELTDIIRRLHVGNYEEARGFLQQEKDRGMATVADEFPDGLKRLIEQNTLS